MIRSPFALGAIGGFGTMAICETFKLPIWYGIFLAAPVTLAVIAGLRLIKRRG